MSQSFPELLTRPEAAQVARVHLATLDRWIRQGTLPVVRLGRRPLIPRAALLAFIEASTTPATRGPLAGRMQ